MPAPFRRLQGVSAVKQFRLTESPENCSAHRGPGLALSALADEEASDAVSLSPPGTSVQSSLWSPFSMISKPVPSPDAPSSTAVAECRNADGKRLGGLVEAFLTELQQRRLQQNGRVEENWLKAAGRQGGQGEALKEVLDSAFRDFRASLDADNAQLDGASKEGAEVEETVSVVTSFSFTVPDGVEPGVTLKVSAPDEVVLRIPLPNNVVGGDQMVMEKNDIGKWGIKHVIRGECDASQLMQSVECLQKTPQDVAQDLCQPHVCRVALRTSKGLLKMRVVPGWAPLGAQRFLQLVTDKYYTDLAVYRAVSSFLVQFGVTGDMERSSKYQALEDDELRGVPILEGMVSFAAAAPDSRVATVCIFLDDFPQLGKNRWETPFGRVDEESLPVLHKLFTGYGDMPQCGGTGPDPVQILEQGNDYIRQNFPQCDFVESAEWLQ
ncbi:cyp-10 [Symbiodinium microadriaticum]|nr:cyp-10 [Symbiodinium microadriaticum]